VFFPGMGAPLAAASLEDVIAAGCRNIVFCGGAGAVVPELALGHVVIPGAALRDEGTSSDYAPPSREIDAEAEVVSTLAEVCSTSGLSLARRRAISPREGGSTSLRSG
jgi:uridine phosphorylase